jgi:hypothetical protein
MTRPTGWDSASRSSLFDDIARTDTSPAKHSESIFEFLNRADGPVWARVRTLMDEWWNEHPDSAQASVRGQIRSGDDHALRAAFFEMYGIRCCGEYATP